MFAAIIIRILTPVILEVLKELLQQLASGQPVQLTEETVKASMLARENEISSQIKGMGLNFQGRGQS